jgi:hypothetical protein
MSNQTDLESKIRERLNQIKSVPARNPQAAARARAHFLAEASAASESRRNKGWGFIFRKQQFALNMVVALVVIVGLFVGGGTTVRAAQDDLPNEPLYAIKTLSEDFSLQFENDPEARVDRLTELTQTRVQEISRMVEAGQTPPEYVRLRLEQHLQQTLQLVSGMEDTKLDQKLLQLRDQLQEQEHDIQDLQAYAAQSEQPVLEHTRTMLQTQLHLVNDGLTNHEVFRNTVNNGFHYGQTQTPPVPSPSPTPLQEPTGEATPEPGSQGQGNGNGLGPNNNPGEPHSGMTPTPGNGNNGTTPGNNGGGNDKDKNKGPKDKDPNPNKPNTRTPKK